MADIRHRFEIATVPSMAYAACATVAGLSSWWTPLVIGESEVGKTLVFCFGSEWAPTKMLVEELVPDELVRWTCVGGASEWIGTNLEYRFERTGQITILRFSQNGWKDATDFYALCNSAWAYYLAGLERLLQGGNANPAVLPALTCPKCGGQMGPEPTYWEGDQCYRCNGRWIDPAHTPSP